MGKWNRIGRTARLWMAVAASGATLAYNLGKMLGVWSG